MWDSRLPWYAHSLNDYLIAGEMNTWMKIISIYLITAHLDSDTLKSENLDSYPSLDDF